MDMISPVRSEYQCEFIHIGLEIQYFPICSNSFLFLFFFFLLCDSIHKTHNNIVSSISDRQ